MYHNSRVRIVSAVFLAALISLALTSCDQLRQVLEPDAPTRSTCVEEGRVLKVGFYAYFAPVSYSADPDPTAAGFHEHRGYEADLLTALESIDDLGATFERRAIPEWTGIWLKSAEPEYDLIGGGITILESRTRDPNGVSKVAFTSGHIVFRQALLARAEDAERLNSYAKLTSDVRVGVLGGTTGEARLLQLAGIADADGVLAAGTRVATPNGEIAADGSANYRITAAFASPVLAGRTHLIPPSDDMPQIVYLDDETSEAETLSMLADKSIDALARGEISSREASIGSDGAFILTALDDAKEYGGFTLALEDADLLACIDERLRFLTDSGNIGYGEWRTDPSIFMKRAELWSARE